MQVLARLKQKVAGGAVNVMASLCDGTGYFCAPVQKARLLLEGEGDSDSLQAGQLPHIEHTNPMCGVFRMREIDVDLLSFPLSELQVMNREETIFTVSPELRAGTPAELAMPDCTLTPYTTCATQVVNGRPKHVFVGSFAELCEGLCFGDVCIRLRNWWANVGETAKFAFMTNNILIIRSMDGSVAGLTADFHAYTLPGEI